MTGLMPLDDQAGNNSDENEPDDSATHGAHYDSRAVLRERLFDDDFELCLNGGDRYVGRVNHGTRVGAVVVELRLN